MNKCHIWTGTIGADGYGRVKLRNRQFRAHRFVYETEVGPIPHGICVLHKCDTPLCVKPDHLFLGSHADNVADKIKKGRQAKCEKNGSAKLTNKDALEIRKSGLKIRELCEKFNVSKHTILRIRSGRGWKI